MAAVGAEGIRYLLDTNILSEPTRATPNDRVLARLKKSADLVATSAICWHELRHGLEQMAPSRKRDAIAGYLDELRRSQLLIVPYSVEAAEWHAQERARLTRKGLAPPFIDGQIAATAHVHGLTLVTRNLADFKHFSGLKTQNWFSPDR